MKPNKHYKECIDFNNELDLKLIKKYGAFEYTYDVSECICEVVENKHKNDIYCDNCLTYLNSNHDCDNCVTD